MGDLLRRKLEALGYGEHDRLVFDESLASRLVSDLIQASQAGESLRKKASDTALQLELANDKVATLSVFHLPVSIIELPQTMRTACSGPCMLLWVALADRDIRFPLLAGRGAHPRDAPTDDGEQSPAHEADSRRRQARPLRAHHAAGAQAPGTAGF